MAVLPPCCLPEAACRKTTRILIQNAKTPAAGARENFFKEGHRGGGREPSIILRRGSEPGARLPAQQMPAPRLPIPQIHLSLVEFYPDAAGEVSASAVHYDDTTTVVHIGWRVLTSRYRGYDEY